MWWLCGVPGCENGAGLSEDVAGSLGWQGEFCDGGAWKRGDDDRWWIVDLCEQARCALHQRWGPMQVGVALAGVSLTITVNLDDHFAIPGRRAQYGGLFVAGMEEVVVK